MLADPILRGVRALEQVVDERPKALQSFVRDEAGGRELATERAFDEVRQGVLLGLARAVGDLASKALDILRGVEGSEVPKEALEVVAADAER